MARFAPRPNSLRERLNGVYYTVYTPLMNRLVLVVSLFLIFLSFIDRASVATTWYHAVEGIVTMLFIGEVVLRLLVMRNGFWESSINVAEAVMCFFCLLVFTILTFAHHTTRLEHNSLIFLRYSAQILRLKGLLTRGGGGSSDVAMGSNMDIHAPGQQSSASYGVNGAAMNL